MADIETVHSELTVIGTGLAGMAAAYFAIENRIDTIQVGVTGSLIYSSGFFDLMGVHPVEEGNLWENPWQAIAQLAIDMPKHPYARMSRSDIESAINQFMCREGHPAYVTGTMEAVPVTDRSHGNSCFIPICMTYNPISHEASITSS